MKTETQTKERLLNVAKEEFMEKGYATASLRTICKKANVTTGALYFLFKDKEDLFSELVKQPLEMMYQLMKSHYEGEMKDVKQSVMKERDFSEDDEAAIMIVEYLFKYHDEFALLLTKSGGSRFENCTDEFVTITEEHYRILADEMSKLYHVDRIDDYTIHWFAHLQIFSFVQLITHNLTKEEALKQMSAIVKFFIGGWFGIYKK